MITRDSQIIKRGHFFLQVLRKGCDLLLNPSWDAPWRYLVKNRKKKKKKKTLIHLDGRPSSFEVRPFVGYFSLKIS